MTQLAHAKLLNDFDRELLSKVRQLIAVKLTEAEVLLYGSAARGERTPESDYDLLILTRTAIIGAQQDEIRDAIYDVALSYGAVVSLIFCARDEWDAPLSLVSPYRRRVEREAIVL